MASFSRGDEAMVRVAMGKQLAGEKLSAQERRVLDRWEKHDREQRAWEYYAAVPKKHYCEMAQRQHKVIKGQADRYGLTALDAGPTVDLRKLLKQFHDFLAANWMRFETEIEEDAIMNGGPGNSPNQERYRGYKADLEGLKVEEKRGDLIPRDDAKNGMFGVFSTMKAALVSGLTEEFGFDQESAIVRRVDEAFIAAEEWVSEKFSQGVAA